MASVAGTRVLGERHVYVVKAGSTLAKGDLIQSTEATGSMTVDNAASNSATFGFTLEAIASGATGLADRARSGDQFWFKISSGTMDDTYRGKFADIVDELTITLTNSNNDVRIFGWDGVTTTYCYGELTTPEASTPTVLA